MLSSWLATDEIKTTVSGFPGSSCSQVCLFSCPFSLESTWCCSEGLTLYTTGNPPRDPASAKQVLEKHQDNICVVRGRKTPKAMHLALPTFCILPVFPNIEPEEVLHRSFVDPAHLQQEETRNGLSWYESTTLMAENKHSSSCVTAAATILRFLYNKDITNIIYLHWSDAILPGAIQRLHHGPFTFFRSTI